MAREPGYCRHKATGQAYVRLGGQVFYLGAYGSEQSRERYNRLKAEWLLNRHHPKFQSPKSSSSATTLADVCLAYLDYAEGYYRTGNEFQNLRLAIKPLGELYASLPPEGFGPTQFCTVRDWWMKRERKVSRETINAQMRRLMRVLKWGVANELVPSFVVETLRCVPPLKRGRCDAPESAPVLPVSDDVVEKTLKCCTPVISDMIRFQQFVGCRPGEVCAVTPAMVDRTSDVWIIKLDHHKTAHHGKERLIYCGPKAQAILSKYLLRGKDEPCFSPAESEQQRREAKHAARKTPLSCGNVPGSNRTRKPRRSPGKAFTAGTYARAIKNACARSEPPIPSWSPNQLRHATATAVRKSFGLEGAQLVLGHSNAQVTQIYAERDSAKAIEIARRIG